MSNAARAARRVPVDPVGVRLALDPLGVALFGARWRAEMGRTSTSGVSAARGEVARAMSVRQALAARCGVNVRQVCRWAVDGLSVMTADRAAVAAGLHPAWVWGDEFYSGVVVDGGAVQEVTC